MFANVFHNSPTQALSLQVQLWNTLANIGVPSQKIVGKPL